MYKSFLKFSKIQDANYGHSCILGLDYRDALPIRFVLGHNSLKIKWMGFSGNDYRVATFSKLYLTALGFIMQNLKLIGHL